MLKYIGPAVLACLVVSCSKFQESRVSQSGVYPGLSAEQVVTRLGQPDHWAPTYQQQAEGFVIGGGVMRPLPAPVQGKSVWVYFPGDEPPNSTNVDDSTIVFIVDGRVDRIETGVAIIPTD